MSLPAVSEALSTTANMSAPVVGECSVEPKASSAKKGKRKAAEAAAFEADKDAVAQPSEEERKDSSGSLIVAKAVRQLLKSEPTAMNLGSDAMPAMNRKVAELIHEAIGRALSNGRKTLKKSDF